MSRRFLQISAACALLALCLSSCASLFSAGRSSLGSEGTAATSAEPDDAPAPDAPIPSDPVKLAGVINRNEKSLLADLRAWVANGAHIEGNLVPDIKLRALYQQRMVRRLTDWPKLSKKVLPKLDPSAYWFYAPNVRAARSLRGLSGTPPKKPPKMRYERAKPPNKLWRFYGLGTKGFRVPRVVLAAVNFTETKFGRVLGPSSAGALGPMQFLPSTWDSYGNGGNIWSPRDSILGAARYLNASGAPERIRDALYAYNPSELYVNVVLTYMKQMKKKRIRFYHYYWWQVFMRTRDGVVQMTGPGSPRPRF
jgi:Transglycosylase SLT domain